MDLSRRIQSGRLIADNGQILDGIESAWAINPAVGTKRHCPRLMTGKLSDQSVRHIFSHQPGDDRRTD
jgi:hypothetical protein